MLRIIGALVRSDNLESLRGRRNRRASGRGTFGFARMRQSDRARAAKAGRDRARSRVRAVESTCSCQRGGLGQLARPTAWT